jgi:hypothetical protein
MRGAERKQWWLGQPALMAALVALVVVVVSAQLHPGFVAGRWVDGVINQWVIVFTVCYLALVVLQGVFERLPEEWRALHTLMRRVS